ncbi:Reverse transcriptase domain-containing protein [Aphis craccivora]|uniref:Reverse transcriptase domain-containing protein n=1 Tax=Aphis craccivora TaxID=307492 RepID=A0A6G0Y878_APHCR|nr:Reverse transcriptase domain-containing protein [Aphis craccivora]
MLSAIRAENSIMKLKNQPFNTLWTKCTNNWCVFQVSTTINHYFVRKFLISQRQYKNLIQLCTKIDFIKKLLSCTHSTDTKIKTTHQFFSIKYYCNIQSNTLVGLHCLHPLECNHLCEMNVDGKIVLYADDTCLLLSSSNLETKTKFGIKFQERNKVKLHYTNLDIYLSLYQSILQYGMIQQNSLAGKIDYINYLMRSHIVVLLLPTPPQAYNLKFVLLNSDQHFLKLVAKLKSID